MVDNIVEGNINLQVEGNMGEYDHEAFPGWRIQNLDDTPAGIPLSFFRLTH